MKALARLAAWCGGVLSGSAAVPPFDPAVAGLIAGHRVGPWLYDSLRTSAELRVSPWEPVLRRACLESLAQTAFDDRIRAEVLRALLAGGVRPVPLKGTVFGRLIYRAPHLRPSHDLDVFVAPEASTRAEAVLLAAGYEPALRGKGRWIEGMSHERAYWRGDDLPVELHGNITQSRRFAVSAAELAAATEDWEFDGVPVGRFEDRVQAAHAIVHAAHHKFAVPLIHWIDVCLLLERVPAVEVAMQCEAWRAQRALWYASEVLSGYLGRPALRAACREPRRMVRLFLGTPAPASRRASPLREHWLGFWLIERRRDRGWFACEYALRAGLDWAGRQRSRQLRSNWGWRSKRRVRLAGSSALSSGRMASPQASQ